MAQQSREKSQTTPATPPRPPQTPAQPPSGGSSAHSGAPTSVVTLTSGGGLLQSPGGGMPADSPPGIQSSRTGVGENGQTPAPTTQSGPSQRRFLLRDHLAYNRCRTKELFYPLKRHFPGDCGYDLTVSRTVSIPPLGFAQVPTNIRTALPPGTWAMIVGRSSTFKVKNLIVNPGFIDNGWRGELFTVAYNPTSRAVNCKAGERISQLILFNLTTPDLEQLSAVEWEEYQAQHPGDRDEQGFGSTGK